MAKRAAPPEGSSKPIPERAEVISLPLHIDDRGHLCQVIGNYAFPEVKRGYIVRNFARGTIRGFHMHRFEWKAYFVIEGSAKFVVLAPDRKEHFEYVLSDQKTSVLVVPPGLYHGWTSLTDRTAVLGLSDRTLEETLQDDLRIDPMTLGPEIWETRAR